MWLENLVAQLLGLVGFVLLSIPAFHAAKYGKLLVKAEAAKPREGSVLEESHQKAVEALDKHRDLWTVGKSRCLRWGTVLSVASYGLASYVAYYASEVK
jgi:hypothetical protein